MTKPQKHKYVVTLSIETGVQRFGKKELAKALKEILEAGYAEGYFPETAKVRVRSIDMD